MKKHLHKSRAHIHTDMNKLNQYTIYDMDKYLHTHKNACNLSSMVNFNEIRAWTNNQVPHITIGVIT